MPHLLSIVSVDSIAHTAIITPVRNFENKTTIYNETLTRRHRPIGVGAAPKLGFEGNN